MVEKKSLIPPIKSKKKSYVFNKIVVIRHIMVLPLTLVGLVFE